jgi:hypothetical protein
MFKFFLFTLVCALFLSAPLTQAQGLDCGSDCQFGDNLVNNPDFESYSSCPTGYSNIALAIGWTQGGFNGSTDFMNACATPSSQVDVPTNIFGSQLAASGDGYAGFYTYVDFGSGPGENYREYLRSQLVTPMEVGQTYLVKMKISLADNSFYATNNLGMYFSNSMAEVNAPDEVNPQVQFLQYVTTSEDWVTVCALFTPTQPYQWIVVGNFDNDFDTDFEQISNNNIEGLNTAYYYIDDISIAKQTSEIPYLQANFTINNPVQCLDGNQFVFNNLSTANCGIEPAYIWNLGDGTTSFFFTPPAHTYANDGNYVVTLIAFSGTGLADTLSQTVTVSNTNNQYQQAQICEGESILLGGTLQTQAGFYFDTYTNIAGCDSIITTQLFVNNQPPNVSLNDVSACGTESVTLSVPQIEGINYNWSTGATTPNITVTQSGIYTVSVSNNCGTKTAQAAVIVGASFSYNAQAQICEGESLFLGGALQTQTGIYTDAFTTAAGCDSIVNTQLTVKSLPPNITLNDVSTCNSQPVTLSVEQTEGVNYNWSTGATTPSITVTQSGNYVVSVSNSCGNKTAQANVAIIATPTLDLGDANQQFCSENTNILDATAQGATTYLWSDGSTNTTFSVTQSGVYTVTVTGECGTTTDQVCALVQSCNTNCTELNILDSYTCNAANGTYTLYGGANGGVPPYQISGTYNGTIGNNQLFSIENISQSTPYVINVTDATGCLKSVLVKPLCGVLPVGLLNFTGKTTANGNVLQWITTTEINNHHFTLYRSSSSNNFVPFATITGSGNSNITQTYSYPDPTPFAGITYYRLSQTDYDGKQTIVGNLSLQRQVTNLSITSIMPIPATDVVKINFITATQSNALLSLHDAAGRLITQQNINTTSGNNELLLDVSKYAAGIYFLSINNGQEVATNKLLKR